MEKLKEQSNVIIVGSGISGIVCASLLDSYHQVTLIEANDRLGGHTHTVNVTDNSIGNCSIDTGFIVFNEMNYPNFVSFLKRLNVEHQPSDMSFGYYDSVDQYWYSSDIPNGIFAQKRNLFSIAHWQLLRGISIFNQTVLADLQTDAMDGLSLMDYLNIKQFSNHVIHRYILPMGAAIWSCPIQDIMKFPAQSFFSFWKNHALLQIKERPVWRTVKGGSQRYIDAFLREFSGNIQLNSPVQSVERNNDGCRVIMTNGESLTADYVIIATHADQALSLLDQPTSLEQSLLGSWTYSNNQVYLHTDPRVMPPTRNAWSSWLVQRTNDSSQSLQMSYYMNRLQSLSTSTDYFVTLNNPHSIAPELLIKTIDYTHPVYTDASVGTQNRLPELNTGRTFFCGSYFGYGFHEDGVRSAVDVCRHFGVGL